MKRTTTADAANWFDVLLETERAQAASMVLSPGQSTGGPENRHEGSEQWLFVISGRGKAVVAGETVGLSAGDLVCIEPRETHEITNTGEEPLETVNLYVPPEY
ncbi:MULTISPECIES: cupin domain-containing protein [unclassified Haladaptatus]|uniref:cupin domain-containing protein n=1 Tax=unclassified Haladaptatus TaxID=2622732 RepID=UPI00209BC1C8|nr:MULTISPECIES: cupin domain-containing protein [unclassified Haladaptatus]MCO8246508.1 cupin domain-containing protein [Haladaptatus sp. AB643]MCO8254746.1 cupin domain-containing protein [Haladaptatus sp. AB618]